LTGLQFGKWTVISRAENGRYRNSRWRCRCECGIEQVRSSAHLRQGLSVHCSKCRAQIHKRPDSAFNQVLIQYKQDAKRRGFSWGLSNEEFRHLTSSPCYYTNQEPSTVKRTAGSVYVYNGIDRLDSSKGYTVENCVPCNRRVNEMKMESPVDEFIEECRAVADSASKYATFAMAGSAY